MAALWLEKKRREAIAAREAAGESLWTENFDEVLLAKLWALVCDCCSRESRQVQEVERRVGFALQRVGLHQPPSVYDLFLNNRPALDAVLTYLGAIELALDEARQRYRRDGGSLTSAYNGTLWRRVLPDLLNSHRIAYKVVDGEFFPLRSEEMHAEVIEPTLELLRGRPELKSANSAYRKAVKEIQQNDPGDAITDAGVALQQALEALGCEGNALGPLIKDARKRGLLRSHDETLTVGIEKFLHWASADRSESGDAHKPDAATLDDAWLMVHIVGALILRLAGAPRGEAIE